jgi:hypothetical protein
MLLLDPYCKQGPICTVVNDTEEEHKHTCCRRKTDRASHNSLWCQLSFNTRPNAHTYCQKS